jgi:hypothetical protein
MWKSVFDYQPVSNHPDAEARPPQLYRMRREGECENCHSVIKKGEVFWLTHLQGEATGEFLEKWCSDCAPDMPRWEDRKGDPENPVND